MSARILVLAGTAEARALAGRLADEPRVEAIASFAGVTSAPAPVAARTRTGGFGGVEGLAGYLRSERIAAVVDATHPFAARMAANAADACMAAGTPRVKLLRPRWEPVGDWRPCPSLVAAAAALPAGARVLLTTGRKEVAPFAARTDLACVLRVIEPVAGLPAHVTQVAGRPPFALEEELALMRGHAITHLVAKNAGGGARAKLDAAARLGVPILMVERPPPPAGPLVADVGEALAWVRETLADGARRDAP